MAELMTRIILRNDSKTNWDANENTILFKGELGIEFTPAPANDQASVPEIKVKIGDGITPWKNLPYFGGNYITKEDGKGLSTNDLTDELKAYYDIAYAHSQADHAPVTAQENVIEQVKVNGTTQTITDKAVDIVVPTKVSDLTNDSGFLTEVPEYSIEKDETTTDFAAVYHLTKDGNRVAGATINIPKDMVVKSGKVITDPEGQPAGTYIEILFQNQDTPVYINVGNLIEYVTSGSNTGDMVVISIDNEHKVTATITDGTITKAKLAKEVQDSLDLADSALQESDIADLVKDQHTHSNKALLDTYTQTEADLADAVAKKHTHTNSDVLDNITADLVAQWSNTEVNTVNGVSSEFNIVTDTESSKDRVLEIAQISSAKVSTGENTTLDNTIAAITTSIDSIYKAGEGGEPATGILVDTIGTPATFKTISETTTDADGKEITVTKEVIDKDGTGIYANTYTRKQIETLIADITGGESAADVLAALNTYKGTNDSRVKAIEDTAITGITVDGTAVTVTDHIAAIDLPIATELAKGVVKSSEAENKVSVDTDGTMEVKALNTNRLVQTTGEWLILNGGSAEIPSTTEE